MSGTFPNRIWELGYAYRKAKALLSAVELGVFTALADGPLDLETLTNRIRIDQRGARDFFDSLVALDLLDRDDSGQYACTPETALYLDCRKSTYLGSELEFNGQLYARWNLLTRALKSGKPQNAAAVKGNYQALYADQSAWQIRQGDVSDDIVGRDSYRAEVSLVEIRDHHRYWFCSGLPARAARTGSCPSNGRWFRFAADEVSVR